MFAPSLARVSGASFELGVSRGGNAGMKVELDRALRTKSGVLRWGYGVRKSSKIKGLGVSGFG